jgi:hypothetical protein
MTTTQAVLLVLIAVSAVIGIWVRASGIRIALAAVLLCIQFTVLAVSFDAHARQVLVAEIEVQRAAPGGAHAFALVREAQLADRVSVALASIGLFLLVVLSPRFNDAQAGSRKPSSSTKREEPMP